MRTLFALLALIFTMSAFALNVADLDQLLRAKGLTVKQFEAKDAQVLMGEVTGHAPFAKVQVVFIKHEAILRSEIEGVAFKAGAAPVLKNVDVIRYRGQFITAEDIEAAIVGK